MCWTIRKFTFIEKRRIQIFLQLYLAMNNGKQLVRLKVRKSSNINIKDLLWMFLRFKEIRLNKLFLYCKESLTLTQIRFVYPKNP